MLGLPDSACEKFEDMYNKCRVCSTSIAPPPRARISGIRATNFGDVILVDHAEIQWRKNKYMVLLVLDVETNLLWTTAQNALNNKEAIQALRLWIDEHNCMPKAIVGDETFSREDFFFLTAERLSSVVQDCCYTGQSPDVLTVFGLDSLQQVQSKGSMGWHGESGGESLTLSV